MFGAFMLARIFKDQPHHATIVEVEIPEELTPLDVQGKRRRVELHRTADRFDDTGQAAAADHIGEDRRRTRCCYALKQQHQYCCCHLDSCAIRDPRSDWWEEEVRRGRFWHSAHDKPPIGSLRLLPRVGCCLIGGERGLSSL